jgi:hypothetical protein
MANDKPTRVAKAKALLATPTVHIKGCSELVSTVLGISYAQAAAIMGPNPTKIGKNGDYDAEAGDIIGWLANPTVPGQRVDHVAIYIGEQGSGGAKIIDVKEPGQEPRKLSSYGAVEIYRSSKY